MTFSRIGSIMADINNLVELREFTEQLAVDAERKVEWTLSDFIPSAEAIEIRNEIFAICNKIEEKIAIVTEQRSDGD